MWVATAAPAQAVLDSLRQTDDEYARAGIPADAECRRDLAMKVAMLTQLMGLPTAEGCPDGYLPH